MQVGLVFRQMEQHHCWYIQDGKIIPFIFSKDTIVLDKFLLAEKVRELERLYSDIRKGNCKNISSFGFQRNAKAM